MRCPGAADVGCLIDEDFCSWWSKRGAVVIESSVELGFGGEVWVDSRGPKEVQGGGCVLY